MKMTPKSRLIRFRDTVRAFSKDTSGVFATIFGVMAIVLIALAGSAVDYTYWMTARNAAQHAADAGALAGATSSETDMNKLKQLAAGFADSSLEKWPSIALESVTYTPSTDKVEATVTGSVDTFFIGLIGINTLPVQARSVAERAQGGRLELALVLDNTGSMASGDGNGSTKIAALKVATNQLLDEVLANSHAEVRVAVVPYSEYVNVGLINRSQPWIHVPADYPVTKQECYQWRGDKYCWQWTEQYKWYGCALSRLGDLRLSDAEPYTEYVGQMDTRQRCNTELVPLTDDQHVVRAAVNGMKTDMDGNTLFTYIPSGLVWGINVLSPTVPFDQGHAYDPDNVKPRKVMVLMTDGDNTLRYNEDDGSHVAFNGNSDQSQAHKRHTDKDTGSLCAYAKASGIEVFTVAFGDLSPQANKMLKLCATSENHYHDAADGAALRSAFRKIAEMLADVVLVE